MVIHSTQQMFLLFVLCVVLCHSLSFLPSDAEKFTAHFNVSTLVGSSSSFVPEIILRSFLIEGYYHELSSSFIDGVCREAIGGETCRECWQLAERCVDMGLLRATTKVLEPNKDNSRFDSLIVKLSHVYRMLRTSSVSSTSSVCVAGKHSSQVLAAILLLNPDQQVRAFLAVDELSLRERQELEVLQRDNSNLALFEFSELLQSLLDADSSETVWPSCDVVHIRQDSGASFVEATTKKVVGTRGAQVIWERRISDDQSLRSESIEWVTRTIVSQDRMTDLGTIEACQGPAAEPVVLPGGEMIELLVGRVHHRRPHPLAEYRAAQQVTQQDGECDSCSYFDAATKRQHYRSIGNAVTDAQHERQRLEGTLGRWAPLTRVPAATSRPVDPSEVLLIATFCYNGELIAPLHLEYLYPTVDLFVIIESRVTFSGRLKGTLFIDKHAAIFEPYLDKIQFVVIDSFPSPPPYWHVIMEDFLNVYIKIDLTTRSRDQYLSAWFRERYQRDVVQDLLARVYPQSSGQKYLLLVVDVDELVDRDAMGWLRGLYHQITQPLFVPMDMFYYSFRHHMTVSWTLAYVVTAEYLALYPVSEIRTTGVARNTADGLRGWHLSYFSPVRDMVTKIESFSHLEYDKQSYKDPEVLLRRVSEGVDIFGRGNANLKPHAGWDALPASFRSFQPLVERYQSDLWEHSHLLRATLWITVGRRDVRGDALTVRLSAAHGVRAALLGLGWTKVRVVSEVGLAEYDRVRRAAVRDLNEHGLQMQIVVGGGEGQWLLPNHLVMPVGSNAISILQTSSCGVLPHRFASPHLSDTTATVVGVGGASQQIDKDVTFLVDILYLSDPDDDDDELEHLLVSSAEDDQKTRLEVLSSRSVEASGVLSLQDWTTLSYFVRRSRVVVVKHTPGTAVDSGLLDLLLSLGKCIVYYNEDPSQTVEMLSLYAQSLWIVSSIDDVYVVSKSLATVPVKRERMEKAALALHIRLQSDTGALNDSVRRCLENSVHKL